MRYIKFVSSKEANLYVYLAVFEHNITGRYSVNNNRTHKENV
jgi:hypothetical protein